MQKKLGLRVLMFVCFLNITLETRPFFGFAPLLYILAAKFLPAITVSIVGAGSIAAIKTYYDLKTGYQLKKIGEEQKERDLQAQEQARKAEEELRELVRQQHAVRLEQFNQLQQRVGEISEKLGTESGLMKQEIAASKTDLLRNLTQLKEGLGKLIHNLQGDVTGVRSDLQEKVNSLKSTIESLEKRLERQISSQFDKLRGDVRAVSTQVSEVVCDGTQMKQALAVLLQGFSTSNSSGFSDEQKKQCGSLAQNLLTSNPDARRQRGLDRFGSRRLGAFVHHLDAGKYANGNTFSTGLRIGFACELPQLSMRPAFPLIEAAS